MASRHRRSVTILLCALALAAGGCAAWGQSSSLTQLRREFRSPVFLGSDESADPGRDYGIETSGTIEARDATVLAELGGRVVDVTVDEGDEVLKGEVLVRLDDTDIAMQIAQARAALAVSQAELGRASAEARPEEISVARSVLQQARTRARGAWQRWQDAVTTWQDPQELQMRITEAQTALALAERDMEMAQADLEAAKQSRDREKWDSVEHRIEAQHVRATEAALEKARAVQAGDQAKLDALQTMRQTPLVLEAQMHAAEATYRTAEADVGIAQADLAAIVAPPLAEDVAIAEANVRQHETALHTLEVMRDKMLLRAPCDGLVSSRAVEVGELAAPGAPLLNIADLSQVDLLAYVPATQIGRVQLNQSAEVTVDAYPGQAATGYVSYIADQAEFTPRNVQTKEERVHTVFAVRITLANPERRLKPGMPADALIRVAP